MAVTITQLTADGEHRAKFLLSTDTGGEAYTVDNATLVAAFVSDSPIQGILDNVYASQALARAAFSESLEVSVYVNSRDDVVGDTVDTNIDGGGLITLVGTLGTVALGAHAAVLEVVFNHSIVR